MTTHTPLILVDGSSYFFRAFHALPPLMTSKGQPSGAIYGVANMIKKLIKDYQPTHMAVVFDAKGKTFRDDWYPAYKAHRPSMPSDLSSQFQPLLDLLAAMGLPLLTIDGVEADDVIGTLAVQASQAGVPVLISTGDKDMAQLVNEHVTLINTMSNHTLDINGVKTKFGVAPEQIIDYLTLVGDTSDNIPGVTKCGPKTAVKWLTEYATLDNLMTNAMQIGGKIGENLRDSFAHLPLSKRLVTIKTDVPLAVHFTDLIIQSPDRAQMLALTREYEFKNWLKELLVNEEAESSTPPPALAYELITTWLQFEKWLQCLQTTSLICFEALTSHIDNMHAELVGIALALIPGQPAYIPFTHADSTPQLDRLDVLAALKPILENPAIGKLGHNVKYTYAVLKHYGITLAGIQYDTMLESYMLNSAASRHDLDSLALKYLGYKPVTYGDVVGSGSKQIFFQEVPIARAAFYAAEMVDVILKLHHALYPLLAPAVQHLLCSLEIPLLTVLADVERHGVLIDCPRLAEHGERLRKQMQALEDEAYTLAGRRFNLGSPKQLQEILYQEQNLPILSKTPTGQPSTAEAALQELAYDYRLPAVILEYRGLSKLVSTYIDALPRCVNKTTTRVHTSYNQAVTATGRLSSSDPNLQNIPIRNDEGRLIRKAFIAPPGHVLLAADYSQIELRIMAHLSQDPNLLQAFANNWDIHTATASEIFGIPLEAVSSEQRRRAKAVNFGLIYGMSSFGLAKQLGIERQDAQFYMDRYFERYPGVLAYMERTRWQAREQGYVETLRGRRLYLPEINAQNMLRRKAAERAAINAPMQGTAADIIKTAMLAIAKWQAEASAPMARMIMQVHDELVFEVPEAHITIAEQAIRELMEHSMALAVPLNVSIGTGLDWDAAHA